MGFDQLFDIFGDDRNRGTEGIRRHILQKALSKLPGRDLPDRIAFRLKKNAVIMFFAILPVLLESIGIHGMEHAEEPANPRGATPVGIKPEWYFLAVYEFLKLVPRIVGIMLPIVGLGLLTVLPFLDRRPEVLARNRKVALGVATVVLVAVVGLTAQGFLS